MTDTERKLISVSLSTIPGLEGESEKELKDLKVHVVSVGPGIVKVFIDPYRLPELLLQTRHNLRVLVPIFDGMYTSIDSLRHRLKTYSWDRYLQVNRTFRVDGVGKSNFGASHFLPLVIKDKIVDYFRATKGKRPSVDTRSPDILLVAFMNGNQLTLYRDGAGKPLNQRGYREKTLEAPMNEVTAAGLISLLDWKGKGLFLDPMTGSGTLAIEAGLVAQKVFPQQSRPQGFGLEHWPDRKAYGWNHFFQKQEIAPFPTNCQIIGADKDPTFLPVAKQNVSACDALSGTNFKSSLGWEIEAFEYLHANPQIVEARRWAETNNLPIFLALNPPFDQRLSLDDAVYFYQSLGDILKNHWKGVRVGVFSGNREALKHLGLRPDRKIPIKNGPLDCRFFLYTIH